MSFFNGIRKLSVVTIASGGAILAYWTTFDSNKRTVSASWTTGYTPSVKWDWNWDKRELSSTVKPPKHDKYETSNSQKEHENKPLKGTATRHLILIRHGQYNLEGSCDDERYLTKLGKEQAALTGERLKSLSLPYTRLIHSTMTRAIETANIILEKMDTVPVEKCDMLREGAPVPPEPPIGSWRPEMHKFYTDGARIEAAFRKYFYRAPTSQETDSYEVIVCHANVIRYFICRSLQLPPEAWLRLSLHNGSITYVTIRPDGRVALKQLGDCGYMPPSVLSFT